MIEVFKGREYTVIVYCDVNDSDDVNVFIDVDKLIICIGRETVIYEEELSEENLNEYKYVYEKFNVPIEKARKFEFDWTDYKYVFRVPTEKKTSLIPPFLQH
jgi:hypothetical protein